MMQYTDRFDNALAYASRIHRSQTRKGSEIPYVSHLLGVAAIAIENGADEDQAIAALLHDAVEDQGGLDRLEDIRARFGERVAQMVDDCTDAYVEPKPAWRPRKEEYIASLDDKPIASLEISLADKTHNAMMTLANLREEGEAIWAIFNGQKEGTLWYYRSIAEKFEARIPGPGTRRYRLIVDEMEDLARAPKA